MMPVIAHVPAATADDGMAAGSDRGSTPPSMAEIVAAVRDGAEAAAAILRDAAPADGHVSIGTLTLRPRHGAGPRELAEAVRTAIARRLT